MNTLRQAGAGDELSRQMESIGARVRAASHALARSEGAQRSTALQAIAQRLVKESEAILAANELDLRAADAAGLERPLRERLALDERGIEQMALGVRQVDALPDPVGAISELSYRPSGIQVGKMRVPLGVVGIIYESRPNVTVDAASLCIKSGNACILRGGSEAIHSNRAIARCVEQGLESAGLPADAVHLIQSTDRAIVGQLVRMNRYVDVLVPRGGRSLIERVDREATIPVIKHLDGICHVYIDDRADVEKAIAIAINSKTSKYAVCNSMETLLVSREIAPRILPQLAERFVAAGVELRGCDATRALVQAAPASEEDWYAEYLAPILAIRVVDDLDAAIAHITQYGSQHTDTIVTEDYSRARRFLREVDSASVMVNASTQFADGFEFGLGAEVGISTNKLHARGPVGLEGLTTQKFVVFGDGQIRQR